MFYETITYLETIIINESLLNESLPLKEENINSTSRITFIPPSWCYLRPLQQILPQCASSQISHSMGKKSNVCSKNAYNEK